MQTKVLLFRLKDAAGVVESNKLDCPLGMGYKKERSPDVCFLRPECVIW